MIYLKRILNLLLWPIRIVMAVAAMIAITPFDALALPTYYVKTGRYYLTDYIPLAVAVAFWICGCDFEWKQEC